MSTRQANWRMVKLGDYISVLTDYHANGSYQKLKENVTLLDEPDYAIMIRTTNFEKNDFTIDLKFIDKHAYGFLAKSKVLPGDILMNKIANAGSVYLMPDLKHPVSLAMNLFLIRMDNESTEQKYVYYYLKENEDYVKLYAVGTAAKTITKQAVRNLQIRLPALPTQRKIAVVLSAYDNLIENNLRRIKILEEMAQNLYREWFVKFRFPGHEKVRMVDSPLGKIPEDWKIVNLPDIAIVKYGKSLPTKKLTPDGYYPVYGAAKIIGRYTEYTREERTIITGCRGSVGKMQITLPKCYVTNNSFTFDIQQRIDFFWLFQSLKERGFADVIGGAAQPQITLDGLSRVQILVPLKATRVSFHKHAKEMFSLLWNLEGRNTTLRQTRDLLLPKLISGELDVSDLEINIPEEAP